MNLLFGWNIVGIVSLTLSLQLLKITAYLLVERNFSTQSPAVSGLSALKNKVSIFVTVFKLV